MRNLTESTRTMIVSLTCLMLWTSPVVHAQTITSTDPFNHTQTGFVLKGVHTTLKCEQCHVSGIFQNTPNYCSGCHAIGTRVGATPKPINHVPTNSECDTCHVSAASFQVKSFKHSGVTSGCSSCHNGQSLGVVSKPANHFPTLLPCENCHINTNTFSIARMDHTGITSGCASCHGGQFSGVVSKPAAHLVTSAPCEVCHGSTSTFLGATFDHTSITAACSTCHMGQQAGVVSLPAVHIPYAGAPCDACHTATNTGGFTSFLGAFYDHVTPVSATNCSSCHSGAYSGVLGKSSYPSHVTTSLQCDSCHTSSNTANFTTFLGVVFNHSTIGTTRCDSCHNGSNATGKPSYHIPIVPAGSDCVACHTSSNTSNYTTFYGATFSHVTITAGTTCSSCHNGVTATGKNAGHIATSSDCSTCHINTASYTTWLGATYTHNPNPPTPLSCPSCHNGVTATGKPAGHVVTTSSCDACHTGANTANYTTFLGASGAIDHSTIAAGTCATCHNGSTATGKPATHIPVAISCDGCHQKYNGTSVLTFAPGTMNHTLVTATTCYTCHNGSYTSQGTMGAQAMPINHIPITITGGTGGLPCTTCHTSPTYTSSTGWLAEKMNHNGAQGGGSPVYCVTCHLSGTSYLGNMQKKSHNGASTSKDCSSSSCHKPIGKEGSTYSSW